jgi:hypothetical protein
MSLFATRSRPPFAQYQKHSAQPFPVRDLDQPERAGDTRVTPTELPKNLLDTRGLVNLPRVKLLLATETAALPPSTRRQSV